MFGRRPTETTRRDECGPARALLQASPDGELLPSEAARLQSHLATCEVCAREARELQSLTGLLRKELDPRVPLPAGAAVVGRILEQSARTSRRRSPVGMLAVPAVAALVVAAVVLPGLRRPLPHPPTAPVWGTVATVETAHVPELVVLDDERFGRQVLLAPAAASARQEGGLNP